MATHELAWDMTNEINNDLDASAICLDQDLNLVDSVWYRKVQSQYGSFRHPRHEQEGNELGDEEKKNFRLAHIQYIGFVINFFLCQELDDVSLASFQLFDPKKQCRYLLADALTNASNSNGIGGRRSYVNFITSGNLRFVGGGNLLTSMRETSTSAPRESRAFTPLSACKENFDYLVSSFIHLAKKFSHQLILSTEHKLRQFVSQNS